MSRFGCIDGLCVPVGALVAAPRGVPRLYRGSRRCCTALHVPRSPSQHTGHLLAQTQLLAGQQPDQERAQHAAQQTGGLEAAWAGREGRKGQVAGLTWQYSAVGSLAVRCRCLRVRQARAAVWRFLPGLRCPARACPAALLTSTWHAPT